MWYGRDAFVVPQADRTHAWDASSATPPALLAREDAPCATKTVRTSVSEPIYRIWCSGSVPTHAGIPRKIKGGHKRGHSPHLYRSFLMVGAPRFELGTPCTPCKCATRLRHAPTLGSLDRLSASGDFSRELSFYPHPMLLREGLQAMRQVAPEALSFSASESSAVPRARRASAWRSGGSETRPYAPPRPSGGCARRQW